MSTANRWDEAVEALMRLAPLERTEHVASIRFAMRFENTPKTKELRPAVEAIAAKVVERLDSEPDEWHSRAWSLQDVPGSNSYKGEALALLRERGTVEFRVRPMLLGNTCHEYRRPS